MSDTGNGATLTRSGFTVDITSISLGNQTIDTLDTTLLSTTGYMTKVAADLADAGTFTVEFNFDAGDAGEWPTVGGAAVSTTVTFPIHDSGNTTNSTVVGTAILTDFKPPDLQNNELQRATATFTWDGETGPTWTAESA